MIIIIGVSGSGKTTIGKLLSEEMNVPFYDADDFHPLSNINKMKQNLPLNDHDRLPWLDNLSNKIVAWNDKGEAILACSALKEKYREILASKTQNILWVFLKGNFKLILARLENRANHYMPKELLYSQFDALEISENALSIDIELTPEEIIKIIMSKIKV